MNKVILFGGVCVDPEMRATSGGNSVLKLRLAVSERFKGKDGQWSDRQEYINCVVWGGRAEGLNKIVRKGTKLLVEGKLATRSYTDSSGAKRYSTEVIASEVVLAGDGGGERSQGRSGAKPEPEFGPPDDDSDLPF
jgi:single-strand DNA-binding protein